jgi:hypothetical protein
VLVEHVLGNKGVRERMSESYVGLAACCDPPEVEEQLLFLFSERFAKAQSLPFGVFMTADFEIIHGFTGTRTLEQFNADLDLVEKDPRFPATAADAAKLAKLGAQAAKDAAAEKWAKVLKSGRAGAAIRGACAERKVLDDAVAAARAYAESRFLWIEEQVKTTTDAAPLNAELRAIQKLFKGEPEETSAKLGPKAVKAALKLREVAETLPSTADAEREKLADEYEDTRWEWLFRERPPKKLSDDEIDWENIPDDELLDDPTGGDDAADDDEE